MDIRHQHSWHSGTAVLLRSVLLVCSFYAPLSFADDAESWQFSGQIRPLWTSAQGTGHDPVSSANALLPGLIPVMSDNAQVQTELHVISHGITAIGTLQGQAFDTDTKHELTNGTAWLNELYTGWGNGAWQFSVGKKIVSWDVAYGFRPNDMIQQEKRQTFITSTLIGRPLAMVDYFDADNAVSVVLVNPRQNNTTDPSIEPALATRAYHHAGNLDWYGFARYGEQTRMSIGTAAAWVVSESIELHASYRYSQKMGLLSLQQRPTLLSNTFLSNTSPWQTQLTDHIQQAVIGTTYTTEDQQSIILEAWWDGAAPSDAQWTEWNQRNHALNAIASTTPSLQRPVAYNLAWQAQLLSAANNVRRKNLYARWSWQSGVWTTAIDTLYTPEDKGRATSASLEWQGDRWHLEAGVRIYGGPANTIFAQLPQNRIVYSAATWAF